MSRLPAPDGLAAVVGVEVLAVEGRDGASVHVPADDRAVAVAVGVGLERESQP